MTLPTIQTFCAETDVQRLLSMYGQQVMLDDNQDGTVDASEDQAMTDCLVFASEEVTMHCQDHYSVNQLQLSNWVARAATVIAAWMLRQRRANPVPEGLQDWYERIMERLEKVSQGKFRIPGLAMLRSTAPIWVNQRAVPHYQFHVLRTIGSTSGRPSRPATTQPRDWDWQDAYTIDLP